MKELISVIIPIYNNEKNLKQSLLSVCNQTYDNLQIIIINDGSTDDSLSVCKNIQKEDKRIEIHSQSNKGVSSARNLGLKKAKGTYVTFIDADDYLELHAYQAVIQEIGDCDAAFWGYREVYGNSNAIKNNNPEKYGIVDNNEALYQSLLAFGYHGFVWNKMFKRTLIKDLFFDETLHFHEDELWTIKAVQKAKSILLIKEILYNYRLAAGSKMRSGYRVDLRHRRSFEAKKELIDEIDNQNSKELFLASLFHDFFTVQWYSYVSNDKANFDYFSTELFPYKKFFYESKEYSLGRKIRYKLIEIAIKCHFSSSIVIFLGEITSFIIKSSIKNKKNINDYIQNEKNI